MRWCTSRRSLSGSSPCDPTVRGLEPSPLVPSLLRLPGSRLQEPACGIDDRAPQERTIESLQTRPSPGQSPCPCSQKRVTDSRCCSRPCLILGRPHREPRREHDPILKPPRLDRGRLGRSADSEASY